MYVQSDTLVLADVFGNFRRKHIKKYEFDPAHFLSALRLLWQTCLKKTEAKLELLIDINVFLMVEKAIRGGICLAIYRFAQANNKYLEKDKKNKES